MKCPLCDKLLTRDEKIMNVCHGCGEPIEEELKKEKKK